MQHVALNQSHAAQLAMRGQHVLASEPASPMLTAVMSATAALPTALNPDSLSMECTATKRNISMPLLAAKSTKREGECGGSQQCPLGSQGQRVVLRNHPARHLRPQGWLPLPPA